MLPKNEKVFNLNVVGEVTGERYEGDFTCISCFVNLDHRCYNFNSSKPWLRLLNNFSVYFQYRKVI